MDNKTNSKTHFPNPEPEQPEPTDSAWSTLMVGAGVLLALAAVGALFFLTAMGAKSVKSHGALKGNDGGSAETMGDHTARAPTGVQVDVERRDAKRTGGRSTSDGNAAGTGATDNPAQRAHLDNATEPDDSVEKGGKSTAAQDIGSGKAISWKSPSTTPSTPERKPMTKNPLVCVFGNRIDWKMHFPEDGLCDLVFYDSLYVHRGNTFQAGGNFTADLRRWLAAVKAYNVTEPGIGVTSIKDAIQLVILRVHLDSRVEAIPGDCRITGSTVWGKPVAEHHPSIASALFTFLTSQSRSGARALVKPHGNVTFSFQHRTLHVEITLQYLRQRRSSFGEHARLFMSVSLAGRWYASLKGGSHRDAYAVGTKCKPVEFGTGLEELGSRVTACTEQHYAAHVTRDELHEVMSTYEGSAGLAFVFDSELTLFAKMCKARNALKDVRPIGLAVFDAEFDDWSNTCTSWNKFGNYTLTRAARKTVDAIGAQNPTHVLDCATLPK
ncbi:hypothetical protein HPB49_018376 [Dermacentor silvarum]|uniref:Uncharacterized protein n=1 Tax=Dermacentor silvarum TaxID=543639 RepID=A0ACB8CZ71_DERSI|nr:hypothetical protein HPB49_018376 [Dermacentor silvarum]